MVLCLVTLTDLCTRRAGLSASAELLDVYSIARHIPVLFFFDRAVSNVGPSCGIHDESCDG